MRQSFRLGRIGGIAIGVHWSVLVITALLAFGLANSVLPTAAPGWPGRTYAIAAIVVTVLFLAGLLAHELAHALLARRFGIAVPRITLWLLGGVSEFEDEPRTPGAAFVIAAAGPVTSLVIGGVAAAAGMIADTLSAPMIVVTCLVWLAGINLILGIFNLLPGAPLDGGRVLHAILWRIRKDRVEAQVAADRAGVVVGLLLAGLGLAEVLYLGNLSGLWLMLLAWFLISAANAETAQVRIRAALDGHVVADLMAPDPTVGYAGQTIDMFVANVAATSRHRVFPVIDLDRRVVGIVHLADLVRVPADARASRRIAELTRPTSVVTPTDPAIEAAKALSPLSPLVPVVRDGQLVGVVSLSDLNRAMELASLHADEGLRHRDRDLRP
jgi:Zn-dependent protease/CBS domain-containing protein